MWSVVVAKHTAANDVAISVFMLTQIIQIMANYRNGSTGQLSAITLTLLFLGALARIFTSIQETGDVTVITTYIVTFTVNAMLLGQVLYYWNVPTLATGVMSDKSK